MIAEAPGQVAQDVEHVKLAPPLPVVAVGRQKRVRQPDDLDVPPRKERVQVVSVDGRQRLQVGVEDVLRARVQAAARRERDDRAPPVDRLKPFRRRRALADDARVQALLRLGLGVEPRRDRRRRHVPRRGAPRGRVGSACRTRAGDGRERTSASTSRHLERSSKCRPAGHRSGVPLESTCAPRPRGAQAQAVPVEPKPPCPRAVSPSVSTRTSWTGV